jgi:hypothetical protein
MGTVCQDGGTAADAFLGFVCSRFLAGTLLVVFQVRIPAVFDPREYLQSLNTGRPPSFSLAYIDCRFPQDHEQKQNAQGESEPGCM